jgi:hypothetical protein
LSILESSFIVVILFIHVHEELRSFGKVFISDNGVKSHTGGFARKAVKHSGRSTLLADPVSPSFGGDLTQPVNGSFCPPKGVGKVLDLIIYKFFIIRNLDFGCSGRPTCHRVSPYVL